jgi:hypothetical protein
MILVHVKQNCARHSTCFGRISPAPSTLYNKLHHSALGLMRQIETITTTITKKQQKKKQSSRETASANGHPQLAFHRSEELAQHLQRSHVVSLFKTPKYYKKNLF